MPSRADVIDRCSRDDVELVRLVYVGSDGVLRGKVVAADRMESVLETGINVPRVTQSFTFLDHVVPGGRFDRPGEARIVPDPDTFRPLTYADRGAIAVCDLREVTGEAWAADPRSRLRSFLDGLAADGHVPSAAFESEFTLCRETDEGLVPNDRSVGYSVDSMQADHGFLLDLVEALEALGMTFESYVPEYGWAQQELVVGHARGVRAADEQVLFRQAARAVAAERDLTATFLPKPFGKAGNGCHLHLSLWSDGTNAFHDPGDDSPYGLSGTARAFVAGVLEHAPALVALTAPTPMSYERLVPGKWASAYTCWGRDNREAVVRVPSTGGDDRAAATRIEYKPADNTANPYLALLGVLAAGRDGVERGLDPGDPLDGDPAALDDAERERRGIRRLPGSLDDALDELEADGVLRSAMGETLHEAYLEVKRYEAEAYAEESPDLAELVEAF